MAAPALQQPLMDANITPSSDQQQSIPAAAQPVVDPAAAQPVIDPAEAVRFIKEKMQSSFDESSAKKLFEFYTLDKNTQRLQPPDVRKLLLDILQSLEWPLVVPDESLNNVLHELCLNDEGSISWIEFKSFFVFLQDKPLYKLFQITTKLFDQKQILYSRLVKIIPAKLKPNIDDPSNNDNDNNDPSAANNNDPSNDDNKVDANADKSYYDRNKWKSAVSNLIPDAKDIFIYFMDGYQILALVIGDFDNMLSEPASAEVNLNGNIYLATIRAFDINADVFPPIARSGGLKSKVARKIADSYIIARQWDEKNLQLAAKAGNLVHQISIKWTQFDQKYKVQEKANATTKSIFNAIKNFDDKHQLTRRLSNGAKQFNDKYNITDKLNNTVTKIKTNDKVQIVSNKISQTVNTALQTANDIQQETKQLVQEKQQQNPNIKDNDNNDPNDPNDNKNDNNADNSNDMDNEGDVNNNNNNNAVPVIPQQQYGDNNNNNDQQDVIQVNDQ